MAKLLTHLYGFREQRTDPHDYKIAPMKQERRDKQIKELKAAKAKVFIKVRDDYQDIDVSYDADGKVAGGHDVGCLRFMRELRDDGQTSIPFKLDYRGKKPVLKRSLVIELDGITELDVDEAAFLLNPQSYGCLFEEVDSSDVEPIEKPKPRKRMAKKAKPRAIPDTVTKE